MSALTKVLEEARALQLRNGVSAREALALAMAQQRRASRTPEAVRHANGGAGLPLQMPAASCLDALLPRDREPSIAEIRDAWQECMQQASLCGEAER